MPPMFPVAISMAFELATYGFVSGVVYLRVPPPGWDRWRGFGETGKVSAAFRGDQAFAALFLVAWIKMASIATAKRTPTGYATAVL